jgi:PAS domain S-box-containing protein
LENELPKRNASILPGILEDKQAQERLCESEERFRAVIDAIPGIIIATTNAEGEMEDEQPDWAALTGQSYGGYRGYGWADAVHPDEAQAATSAWRAAAKLRKSFVLEHRVRRSDGQWQMFSVRAIPLFDKSGAVRGWVSAHTGVTERRDAGAPLQSHASAAKSERDWAWNSARDMLAILDGSGIILAANPAWTASLGWQAGELTGRNALDFIQPDDRATAREALASAAAGVPQTFESRARSKGSSYRTISWVAALDRGFVHVGGRDVTADKEAAKALQQSEAWMRAIFETSDRYKSIVALDGALLKANPASLLGIEANPGDVIGKLFWDTPWFTETPALPEIVKGAIAGAAKGEMFREEVFINLPAGLRWFDFTIGPVQNANGEIAAIISEAADITARRQAEEALRQSQKLEVIAQITGGMAHDFNNLLTPIAGSLDLIKRRLGSSDERAARLLSGAIESAERARILVQRLLTLGRRQHLDPRAVDIAALVRGLSNLLARSLGPRIEIRLEMEAGLPPAKIDPNQLELALLNLAVNSRDAMPGGGVLCIAAKVGDVKAGDGIAGIKPGTYICLAVTDTGRGMDRDTLARAIEPFHSTKGAGKRTGLGLSMVDGLATQYGGKLVLQSAPGNGTTASLWLPAAGAATSPNCDLSGAAPSR